MVSVAAAAPGGAIQARNANIRATVLIRRAACPRPGAATDRRSLERMCFLIRTSMANILKTPQSVSDVPGVLRVVIPRVRTRMIFGFRSVLKVKPARGTWVERDTKVSRSICRNVLSRNRHLNWPACQQAVNSSISSKPTLPGFRLLHNHNL